MKWIERQERVEYEAFSAIDELCEEFNLKISFYPKVYWVGRTLKFEDFGFPTCLEEEFDERINTKQSCYFYKEKVILINKYRWHDIFEESSHFLHISVSQLDLEKKTLREGLWMNVMVEMLGFFGARVLGSKAVNDYFKYPDLMKFYSKEKDYFNLRLNEVINFGLSDSNQFYNCFIYQQGYYLGDILFHNLIKGKISNKEISTLFRDKLDGKNYSRNKVLELRERFWKLPLVNC